jgi:hypothetical protein
VELTEVAVGNAISMGQMILEYRSFRHLLYVACDPQTGNFSRKQTLKIWPYSFHLITEILRNIKFSNKTLVF